MIILLLLCLLASSYQTKPRAVDQIDREKLKQQAQELSDAVVSGNYARAADLTFPKLVKLMGGRQQFIATMEKAMAETSTDQFRISSVTVGEPGEIIQVNRQHYAIVSSTMRFKVAEGTLVGEAFMIGVSADGGKNWAFIDSGGRAIDKNQLRTLIGPAADKLRIPETKRPVLHRGANE